MQILFNDIYKGILPQQLPLYPHYGWQSMEFLAIWNVTLRFSVLNLSGLKNQRFENSSLVKITHFKQEFLNLWIIISDFFI